MSLQFIKLRFCNFHESYAGHLKTGHWYHAFVKLSDQTESKMST